jgi:DNA-binding transcriptional MerR regulator
MQDFSVAETASQVGCHRNTVIRYERRGLIHALRDINGFRRFPALEVDRLKRLLSTRIDSGKNQEVSNDAA